ILTPTFLPGFQASVDFYDINIKGSIFSVGAQDTIYRCAQGQQFYCNQIFSNVTGTVATPADLAAGRVAVVNQLPFNLATQHQQGLDFDVTYQRNLSEFVDSWNGNLLLHGLVSHVGFQRFDDALNPVQDQAGNNSNTGPVKWRYYLQEMYNL